MHRTCHLICAFFFLFPSLVTILGQSGGARDAEKDQAAQTLPMFHIMKPITIRKFNRISQHIPLPVGNYFSFLSDFNEKMPDSVAFTWFPMWWFFFDLCLNSTTLKVVWSSKLRCSVEPFAKKLLHIFLHVFTNTERGRERHFQTLQCLSKLLNIFNSGTLLELDQREGKSGKHAFFSRRCLSGPEWVVLNISIGQVPQEKGDIFMFVLLLSILIKHY